MLSSARIVSEKELQQRLVEWEITAIDQALEDLRTWATRIELEARKLADAYTAEKRRLQQEEVTRQGGRTAGKNSTFSQITFVMPSREGTVGLYWHKTAIGKKTGTKFYQYIRTAKGGNYTQRSLTAYTRDWEEALVLATEANAAHIRNAWRQLTRIRKMLLQTRSDVLKAAKRSSEDPS